MRKSWFTESQIVAILKEGEAGVTLSELTRKDGISRAADFNGQAKYGVVSVSELKRMKGLGLQEFYTQGKGEEVDGLTEKLLVRPAISMDQYLAENVDAFREQAA
jgi:hypothetical protein